MSESSRREFLAQTGAAALAAGLVTSVPKMTFGEDPASQTKKHDRPTLVTIYLRGGADGVQIIVPYGDPLYYQIRPTIAVPQQDVPADKDGMGAEKGVLKINNYFGMHPSAQPLFDLFNAGVLAPIVNVGSPNDTRSHFDAQDFMERAAPGVRTVTEGWLNRYLSATKDGADSNLRGLSIQPLLPRSLRGQYPVLAVPDASANRGMDTFEQLYGTCEQQTKEQKAMEAAAGVFDDKNKPVAANVKGKEPAIKPITELDARETISTAGTDAITRLRELQKIIGAGGAGTYPNGRLGSQLKDIAQVIKANRGLEVAAVDYGGWDHHAYEGGSNGQQANMIGHLAQAMKAFYDDLGETRMKRVLVLVMSEFGRTARENGNNGTDHGRGGLMLAMGGMVKGKNIYGKWTGLDAAVLADRRDMPVTTDFRLVFAETLFKLFNYDPTAAKFFPDYKPAGKPLDFLSKVEST